MQVGKIEALESRRQPPPGANPPRDDAAVESRALVAIDPLPGHVRHPSGHGYAPFVAQLVATKEQHPQTRERRRADPNDASAAYRATAALTG
jgi:hypothetical protein